MKADGDAAGSGVIVAETEEEAIKGINRCMVQREFGAAGDR